MLGINGVLVYFFPFLWFVLRKTHGRYGLVVMMAKA